MRLQTRHRGVAALGGMVVLGSLGGSGAVLAASTTEPNDTFGTRQTLPVGTSTVTGSLSELVADINWTGNTLDAGLVGAFDVNSLTPDEPYVAWTDNTASGVDTILGSFDDAGGTSLRESNDDGGPGGLFSSLIADSVLSNGSIHLRVTGFDDFSFDGSHTESGAYDLFIDLGRTTAGDIDFLTFTGLAPGTSFIAEITTGTFDSLLGWLTDLGDIMEVDDDGGDGLLSRIAGTVPGSGILNLAVSGFGDFGLTGGHLQTGEYELSLDAQLESKIPGPPTFALLGFGFAGVAGFQRRRKLRT